MPLFVLLFLILSSSTIIQHPSSHHHLVVQADTNIKNNIDYLTENSVVMITGACGFVGSELAMALHRTYNVKKLILIDSMDSGFGIAAMQAGLTKLEQQIIDLTNSDSNNKDKKKTKNKDEKKKQDDTNKDDKVENNEKSNNNKHDPNRLTEEQLALFDFKKQRLFHMLQILGSKGYFYRIDFRPMIPEYYDLGEVPILNYIFNDHPDVTHVIHLADSYHDGSASQTENDRGELLTQAVPRIKEQTKAGMIESLLEQIKKHHRDTNQTILPHLTYASTHEVYNFNANSDSKDINNVPFTEDKPITTPSSLRGATKLIDEILTRTYYQTSDIYSVGLRIFNVYGPWGLPGSPLYEMSQRAVSDTSIKILSEDEKLISNDQRDYIYIDDVIDGIMSAMQFRPSHLNKQEDKEKGEPYEGFEKQNKNPHPVIFNLGTGVGTSLKDITKIMNNYIPRTSDGEEEEEENEGEDMPQPTISYANTERSEKILGFKPQVSLKEGILKLLAWHYDRVYPYGRSDDDDDDDDSEDGENEENKKKSEQKEKEEEEDESSGLNFVASKGIASCSPYDKECLNGSPVFPCSSECSHSDICTTSFYTDDILDYTQKISEKCDVVMYTISLDDSLQVIPSHELLHSTKFQNSFVHPKTSSSSSTTANTVGNNKLLSKLKGRRNKENKENDERGEDDVRTVDSGLSCNVAFVSEHSVLVRRLKEEQNFAPYQPTITDEKKVLKHGFWTLVPILINHEHYFGSSTNTDGGASNNNNNINDESMHEYHMFSLLPKLSPGLFFGPNTKHAIYCDTNVIFQSIPALLEEALMQPYKEGKDGGTAMLIGTKSDTGFAGRSNTRSSNSGGGGNHHLRHQHGQQQQQNTPISILESIQSVAYRAIKIGVIDEISNDGVAPIIDSSWLVHTLLNEDSRLFRCDVFGEIIQWNVASDVQGMEFIMALHDMWSRVVVRWSDDEPWWVGQDVVTVLDNNGSGSGSSGDNKAQQQQQQQQRRLQEEEEEEEEEEENEEQENDNDEEGEEEGESENDNEENNVEGEEEGEEEEVENEEEEEEDNAEGEENEEEEENVENDNEVEAEGEEGLANDNEEGNGEGNEEGEEEEIENGIEENNSKNERETKGGEGKEEDETDSSNKENNDEDSTAEQVLSPNEEAANDLSDEKKEDKEGDPDQEDNEVNKVIFNIPEKKKKNKKSEEAKVEEAKKENAVFGHGDGAVDSQVTTGEEVEEDSNDIVEEKRDELNTAGGDNLALQEETEEDIGMPEDDEEVIQKDEEEQDKQQVVDEEDVPDQVLLQPDPNRDVSSYDTWMGILSSPSTHYFVRIIPSSQVGVFYLDDE